MSLYVHTLLNHRGQRLDKALWVIIIFPVGKYYNEFLLTLVEGGTLIAMVQGMEESIVKKVICLSLLLSFFISTTATATDGTMIGTGATAMGVGLGFVFLPMMMSGVYGFNEPPLSTKVGCYIGGGATIALGLALVVWGSMRGEYYATLKNPVLDIVSVGIDGKKTSIKAKFSF